jgi:Toprim domain-containing protein
MNTPLSPEMILEVAKRAGRQLKGPLTNGEYLIQCPWPENHMNGDAHPSCRLNPNKGVFFCDPCGQGGRIVDLANALGVPMPDHTQQSRPKKRTRKGGSISLQFTANGPLSEATRQDLATRLRKDFPLATWEAFGAREGMVSPGDDHAVGFPLSRGGWYVALHHCPDAKHDKPYSLVYTDGGKAGLLTAGLDRPGPVLVCEGPWDAMQAYTDGFAVATGTSGAGTWRKEWSIQLLGHEVVDAHDKDAAGQAGAEKALSSLRSLGINAHRLVLPLSGSAEEKDLSDYRKTHSADELRELVRLACEEPAGLAGSNSEKLFLASAIDVILGADLPARIKRREAAKLVIEDLSKRGDLIQTPGGQQFWYERERRRLHDLDSFTFRSLFIENYQVNPAEPEFRHMMEAIRSATRSQGKFAAVYRFAYYQRTNNRLYLSAGLGRVVRLDGHRIEWIDNGADGVLFEETEDQQTIPEGATFAEVQGDPIYDCILSRVNFSRGTGVILTPEHQRLILRVWVLAVFFPELLPSRVLLLLYGEKGSGKTSTLRAILKLLLGPKANVTPLTKEDGFNAAVSQEFILVLDNVDSYCRWIEDRLATVATGQTIRLRKLYTTNQMLSFPTRCCLALTARTPRFRRDDVVDRLAILRVDRLEKFKREAEWYAEVEEQRTQLWAQLLRDLNGIVARLQESPIPCPDSIRMADWGFVALTIGSALGREKEVSTALEAAEVDKAYFLLEADELYEHIHCIAIDKPDQEWKAGDLFIELKTRAQKADVEFNIKSPKSLGRILHRLEPALKFMIRFEIRDSLHDGQAVYLLGPLPEPRKESTPQKPPVPGNEFHDPDF